MSNPAELESEFWSKLKSDQTVMLGLEGREDGRTRPLTAVLEQEGRGPIWFFTSQQSGWVQDLHDQARASVSFISKAHDLYASVQGNLFRSNDRATIDRLWNPFIAAWYEGKDDPNLVLLRYEADAVEIWRDGSSLLAGIKMLLGSDPKEDYKDNVVKLALK